MRTEKTFQVKIIKAVPGMANKPGDGVVVNGTTLHATGLSKSELATWTYDDFASNVSKTMPTLMSMHSHRTRHGFLKRYRCLLEHPKGQR